MHHLDGTPYACIACRVGRLRGLAPALAAAWLLPTLLLAQVAGDPLAALLLAVPCLAGPLHAWFRGGPGFRPGWTLQWHADGGWWLGEPGARGPRPARLLPGGLHHRRLTVLVLQCRGGPRVTALLGPGNLPPAEWRRLRVRLGWPAGGEPSGPGVSRSIFTGRGPRRSSRRTRARPDAGRVRVAGDRTRPPRGP